MTKVAVWCRHEGDNIIGIGSNIPWQVPSDKQFFKDLIDDQVVVMGRKTYVSLPESCYEDSKIIVLTKNGGFELQSPNHFMTSDINVFKDTAEDLYIAGGNEVYKAFITGGAKLKPEIIVDCVYKGEMNTALSGDKIDISECVEEMKKSYFQISADNVLDEVIRAIYVRRGEFVDQAVLKRIIRIMEREI